MSLGQDGPWHISKTAEPVPRELRHDFSIATPMHPTAARSSVLINWPLWETVSVIDTTCAQVSLPLTSHQAIDFHQQLTRFFISSAPTVRIETPLCIQAVGIFQCGSVADENPGQQREEINTGAPLGFEAKLWVAADAFSDYRISPAFKASAGESASRSFVDCRSGKVGRGDLSS